MNRRSFISLAAVTATAQTPPAISPVPTLRDWTNAQPVQYPDPDVIALDPKFRRYMIGNTAMKRLYVGSSWAEGPAWNGAGRFLVWSDIPGNTQLRWIEDDNRVTTSEILPAIVTATPSTMKAASSLANTAGAAWSVTRQTAQSPSLRTSSKASG